MSKSLALDDFLGHETKSGGSSQFLRGWRKRKPPIVDVFLHRKSGIIALWQHNVPRVYEKKLDGGGKELRVFGGSWNCLESEDVLKKQYRREKDTGERTVPPVMCPVCRTMEFFRAAYREGAIGFAEPLFKFVGDDPKETQLLTFGGMCSLYGSDYLSDEEKEVVKNEVSLKEAWKENINAKCNYLFVVVDADNHKDGVQIAVETTSLGDHVKECIRNQMTSLGEDDGNPILNPYALRWEHNAEAKEFGKKYKCIAMPKIALTKEVEALINSEPPDLENIVRPGNVTTMRASLEGHYIGPVEVDWDGIFGPAERAGFGHAEEDQAAGADEEESKPQQHSHKSVAKAAGTAKAALDKATADKPAPAPEVAPAAVAESTTKTGGRRKKEAAAPPPPPATEQIPCDECGAQMAADATVCPQCGAEYELEAPPADVAPAPTPAPATKGKGTETKKGVNF